MILQTYKRHASSAHYTNRFVRKIGVVALRTLQDKPSYIVLNINPKTGPSREPAWLLAHSISKGPAQGNGRNPFPCMTLTD